MYTRIIAAVVALAFYAPVAHAEPTDPYGDDYISLAKPTVADAGALLGYGTAGTPEQADAIALNECRNVNGQDCSVIATNYHGCVAYAFADNIWHSAKGATPDIAEQAASSNVSGTEVRVISRCST